MHCRVQALTSTQDCAQGQIHKCSGGLLCSVQPFLNRSLAGQKPRPQLAEQHMRHIDISTDIKHVPLKNLSYFTPRRQQKSGHALRAGQAHQSWNDGIMFMDSLDQQRDNRYMLQTSWLQEKCLQSGSISRSELVLLTFAADYSVL